MVSKRGVESESCGKGGVAGESSGKGEVAGESCRKLDLGFKGESCGKIGFKGESCGKIVSQMSLVVELEFGSRSYSNILRKGTTEFPWTGPSGELIIILVENKRVSDAPRIAKSEQNLPSPSDFFGYLLRVVWPIKVKKELLKDPPPCGFCPLAILFDHVKPEYPDEITEMVSNQPVIEIGKHFDVVSLLSCNYETNYLLRNNNADDLVELNKDLFRGKTVMVCCFNVPYFREYYCTPRVQALATLCSDLFSQKPNEVEMVLVPKMHSLANHEVVFDHFLKGFPSPCLAVPFSDSKRRDYICKYLGLRWETYAKCILVDGSSNVLYHNPPDFVVHYGPDAFPFTWKQLQDLVDEDFPFWKSPATSTLEGLLKCKSPQLFNPSNMRRPYPTVSSLNLKEKVVGLYLYVQGDFIHTLNEVYQQCRAKSLEFEVVMVCLPFVDCLDSRSSVLKVASIMKKHNMSWWMVHFNNSVSRRLWRIILNDSSDKLIILGPNDAYVDPYGREVMRSFGVSGFPFTREGLVEREYTKLKDLTLEAVLVYESRNFVFRHDEVIPVEDLKEKNILVYFGCLESVDLYHDLLKWYDEIKKKDSSFEVVFVRRAVDYYAENTAEDDEVTRSVMPWLVCPFNADHSNSVQEKLFLRNCAYDTLVQFGTDGCIRSFLAQKLLSRHGTDAFPFDDHLHQDIIYRLKSHFRFMHSYE